VMSKPWDRRRGRRAKLRTGAPCMQSRAGGCERALRRPGVLRHGALPPGALHTSQAQGRAHEGLELQQENERDDEPHENDNRYQYMCEQGSASKHPTIGALWPPTRASLYSLTVMVPAKDAMKDRPEDRHYLFDR
jgi:hypothetical protein